MAKSRQNRIFTATHAHPIKRLATTDDHEHKRQRMDERTDFARWRMKNDGGIQTWHYLESDEANKNWPQSIADKYYLGLPLVWVYSGTIFSPTTNHLLSQKFLIDYLKPVCLTFWCIGPAQPAGGKKSLGLYQ